jgi:hypothetical protein
MNKILFTLLLLALPSVLAAQSYKHKAKSGVVAVSTGTQTVFGRSIGYYVKFKNNSNKKVDGLKWKATFTNNFGEILGVKEGMWQSGNFISPIGPGSTTEEIETSWVKGGLKIWITITDVHFVE